MNRTDELKRTAGALFYASSFEGTRTTGYKKSRVSKKERNKKRKLIDKRQDESKRAA